MLFSPLVLAEVPAVSLRPENFAGEQRFFFCRPSYKLIPREKTFESTFQEILISCR